MKDLDPIIVTRRVPAIHIFLTLESIDPKTPGYQKAKTPTPFWPEPTPKHHKKDEDYAYKNKKNNNVSRNYPHNRQSTGNRPQKNQQTSSGPSSSTTTANRKQHNKPKKDDQPGTSTQAQES